ncbi:MAG: hypothetical protein AAGD86_05190 [Pseudomonadota bacterium]
MQKYIGGHRAALVLCAMAALGAGCDSLGVNSDVIVASGSEQDGSAFTVNGDILVGEDAVVRGDKVATVNGSIQVRGGATVRNVATTNGNITVGEAAQTGNIETVNGGATCGDGARVEGDITLVNGSIVLARSAAVVGDVATVNGSISLTAATVGGELRNYHGDILLDEGSEVAGGLSVLGDEPPDDERLARIVIGPNSTVRGELVFEHPVELFVHESASVGTVRGADAVSFSGPLSSVVAGSGG